MSKFYLTTPIYYINAEPHLGHAYTTVAADVLARYHRLIGDDTFFLTGTDEHGAKIAQAAAAKGIKPQVFADAVVVRYSAAWKKLNIAYDDFIRTTEERHIMRVEKLLTRLKDEGWLYQGRYEGLYCIGCEAYIKEANLVNGLCPDHQKPPQKISEENWFFKLSAFQARIKDLLDSGEFKIKPKSRENEARGFLEQGLEDLTISRQNMPWGIKMPFDTKQTVYVWVEALFNYLTALEYPEGKRFKQFWPPDVQLLGKDILKFHAVIWPALLLALDLPLPQKLCVHGFFTVDGLKMSKTIGNVLDPGKLATEYGADAVRYFLLSEVPFGQDGDVSASRFAERYNSDLANNLGNLVSRTLSMIERYRQGRIPAQAKRDLFETADFWLNYEKEMRELNFYRILGMVQALLVKANRYIDDTEPWRLARENDKKKLPEVLYNLAELMRHISIAFAPFLPDFAGKLRGYLGLGALHPAKFDFSQDTEWGKLSRGTIIRKGEALFPRLNKS